MGSEGHNGIVGAPADADGASQSLSELSLLHQLQEAGVSLNFGGSSDMTEKIVQRVHVGGGGSSPSLPIDGIARHRLQTPWHVEM